MQDDALTPDLLCVRRRRSPRWIMSVPCVGQLMSVMGPCLPRGSSAAQVTLPTSSLRAPRRSCLRPVQGPLPKGKTFLCGLGKKEIFYITNLVMLLLPNFSLEYLSRDFGIL